MTVQELEAHPPRCGAALPVPADSRSAGAAAARLPARPARAVRRSLLMGAALLVAAACALLAASPGARLRGAGPARPGPGIEIERRSALPTVPYRQFPAWGTRCLARARRCSSAARSCCRRTSATLTGSTGRRSRRATRSRRSGETTVQAVWVIRSGGSVGRTSSTRCCPTRRTSSRSPDGAPGVWMHGGDHIVFYLAPGERNPDLALHHRSEGVLAGNVLAWRKGGLLYRLEAQVSKQRALGSRARWSRGEAGRALVAALAGASALSVSVSRPPPGSRPATPGRPAWSSRATDDPHPVRGSRSTSAVDPLPLVLPAGAATARR